LNHYYYYDVIFTVLNGSFFIDLDFCSSTFQRGAMQQAFFSLRQCNIALGEHSDRLNIVER